MDAYYLEGNQMSKLTLSEYQSIKVVEAAKIVTITDATIGLSLHKSVVDLEVGQDFIVRHQPEIGGYFVRYEDGYESYSTAAAFIGLAKASFAASFGVAIELLKEGDRVARKGWNGKDMYLVLVGGNTIRQAIADNYGQAGKIYPVADAIYMKTADNKLVPWLASQTDVLAEDWVTVEAAL